MLPEIGQDRPRVVELVRGGDEPDLGGSMTQVIQVRGLALPPWRFRRGVRVCASVDDGSDRRPVIEPDIPGQPRVA